jgi:hypothetical protein
MALDKLGEFKPVRFENFFNKKAAENDVAADRNLTATTKTSKLGENNFTANLQKDILFKKFDLPTKPLKEDAADPVDYFEIDKQADELIKKYTEDGFFSDSLNTDDLGKELGNLALTEPERAAALTDNILDKIDGGDKDELAQSFVESIGPAGLRELAKNEKGKELLGTLRHHLDEGVTWGDEDATMARIDTAIKAADFEQSAEFKNLSPEAQTEILNRLDSNQGNNAAVDNLINLAKSEDFANLPIATQKQILEAYDANKEDKLFVDGLRRTAENPEFQGLNETQQAAVVADLEKIAQTESYGDEDNVEDKAYLLDLISGTSVYSQQHPEITSVRNTLDKVLSGEIKVEVYYKDDGLNGFADGDTISMNRRSNESRDISGQLDTFVHEVNHILGGDTDAGTPDRFISEYRARVVGREAGGQPFSAEIERQSLEQLTTGGGAYQHLNDLYNNDPKFAAVIDEALAKLDEVPPVLTTPEQLRQNLLDAGFDSDYLNTPGNLDNH